MIGKWQIFRVGGWDPGPARIHPDPTLEKGATMSTDGGAVAPKTRTRVVFLLYTHSDRMDAPVLLEVYGKSSYQQAYNRLADIAEQLGQKYPMTGEGKVVLGVVNPKCGQRWWLERREVK